MKNSVLKRAAAVCFSAVILLCVSVSGFSYYAAKIAKNGAEYTDSNGNTGKVPGGETVLAYEYDYTGSRVKALYDGKSISFDESALVGEYDSRYDMIEKTSSPQKYRVTSRSGVVIREEPTTESARVGGIPSGKDFVSSYYYKDEFNSWVFTEYNGVSGWVFDANTAKLPEGRNTVIVVHDGAKLVADDGSKSKPIPAGTELKYEYYNDFYWEGGYTAYYTEYKGFKGWINGCYSAMEIPEFCETTVNQPGYVMLTDGKSAALWSGPFGTGEKLDASAPLNKVLSYDSYADRTIEKKTGKVLKEYNGDYEFYESDEYTDLVVTCRVSAGETEGWVTFTASKNGYFTSYLPGRNPVDYYVASDNINAYKTKELSGEKTFTIPELSLFICYFSEYRENGNSRLYVEYNGKYGWIKGDFEKMQYGYSETKTAYADIELISDLESKESFDVIPAGGNFNEITVSDEFTETTGGYTFVKYDNKFGWIPDETDYMRAGVADLSEFIDISVSEEPETDSEETEILTKETQTGAVAEAESKTGKSGKTESPTDEAETQTEKAKEPDSAGKKDIIIIAAAAALIIAIAVIIITGRKRSKNENN